jgi:hypothetical protein
MPSSIDQGSRRAVERGSHHQGTRSDKNDGCRPSNANAMSISAVKTYTRQASTTHAPREPGIEDAYLDKCAFDLPALLNEAPAAVAAATPPPAQAGS